MAQNTVALRLYGVAAVESGHAMSLAEGTTLDVVGGSQTVDGLLWRNVRDPSGTIGWIAAPFSAPMS